MTVARLGYSAMVVAAVCGCAAAAIAFGAAAALAVASIVLGLAGWDMGRG